MATPKIAKKNAKRAKKKEPKLTPASNISGGPGAGKPPKPTSV